MINGKSIRNKTKYSRVSYDKYTFFNSLVSIIDAKGKKKFNCDNVLSVSRPVPKVKLLKVIDNSETIL